MGLENVQVVDAISTDKNDTVNLTIFDAWDWVDEGAHLLALQNKINTYLDFVQSKQIYEARPTADGKVLVIQVISKFPISEKGVELLRRANIVATKLDISITQNMLSAMAPPSVAEKR